MSLTSVDDPAAPLLAVAAGLLIGSFLNVVIFRGPRLWGLVDGEDRGSLAAPRSYCPACRRPLAAWRLIPIASFIAQRGRCASCGAPISARYPIVEALGAFAALTALAVFGATWAGLCAAIFGWALIALAFIDLETGYLPDAITLPLIAFGLIANGAGLFASLPNAIIGAIAGFAVFWAIGRLFAQLRGREGLGLGDAKLLAAIGAWGGWMILPMVVLAGAVATLLAIVTAKIFGRATDFDQPVPFGPGLCAAGFIFLLAAPRAFTGL